MARNSPFAVASVARRIEAARVTDPTRPEPASFDGRGLAASDSRKWQDRREPMRAPQ